ncbi:hypothetical protein [Saccharopolyspora sp. NPDC049426]
MREIAAEKDATVAQLAIAWVARRARTSCPSSARDAGSRSTR